MNEKQKKQIIEYIKENQEDLDILYYINDEDINEIEDEDDLRRYFEDLNENREVTDEDITYHSNAIEYLKENDASLNDSLEIAQEYGYTIDNINSELLASLLKTRENEENYNKLIENICSFYEEIKEV